MRMFAWTLMVVFACTIGCNQPVETIPAVAPESSGTTDAHADHDHEGEHGKEGDDHDGHSHAEEGGTAAETEASESAEAKETESAESAEAKEGKEDSASNTGAEMIRFVADKRINVPSMMCPYSCWPKVKETLAGQPGVAAVQLAEQPEGTAEGEIVERVVELKLNGDFDVDAAIAALAKVSFEDAKVAN